jgi:hypothetical protein
MKLKALLAGVAALAIVSAASNASATIYFDPFSSNQGDASGSDVYGNSWSWSGSTWSYSGVYGNASQPADDFEISFVGGITGISSATFNGVAGVISGSSVAFYFPTVTLGDAISASITVVGGALNPGITATYTYAAPELSTWAMMLAGFAGLGFAGYRRRAIAA